MATTIKLKNGSGAPLAGNLVQGEPALDLTNKRLYTEDSLGAVIEIGTNPTSLTTGTFTSTGIDDNATSTAITIASDEAVTFANDINLPDNGKAIFGASSDLQIYHDGLHSYIDDVGTGQLRIRATNLEITNSSGTQNMIVATDGGSVSLRYAGGSKLATTSTGVDVTGTAVTDGLTVAGNVSVDGGTIKLDGNFPTGTSNTALGDAALDDGLLTGGYNTAIGNSALTANTTGSNNTAVGYQSLYNTTTGTLNTAIGKTSARTLTTGTQNVALGTNALYSNTTGSFNVAVGKGALGTDTTASGNVAIGGEAANSTDGAIVTAVGYQALKTNTSGGSNTGLGYRALYLNTTGGLNTAVGRDALRSNTTASNNTAVGYQSLYSNTTASSVTAVGQSALYSNSTGAANTALGRASLRLNTIGSNNVAVGNDALETNASGGANTAIGTSALQSTTASSNTAIGANSGRYITTGAKNTILGPYDGNQGGLDIRTASNNIVLADGDGDPKLYYKHDSLTWFSEEIRDKTTASAANTYIDGTSGYFARSTSSRRYKNTINDATHGLTELLSLRPVTYKGNNDGDTVFGGLIAEEVHDAGLTEFVQYNADGEPDALAYGNMVSLCIKAIQQLSAKVDALEAQLSGE